MGLKCEKCQLTLKDKLDDHTFAIEIPTIVMSPIDRSITIGYICRNCGNLAVKVIQPSSKTQLPLIDGE